MADPPEPPAPLLITGKNGQPVQIQHVRNSEAIKYLGCHKCPLNQKQQAAAIKRKCDDYARVINCSRLSRRGTQVFYQAIYRLSVGYPLPMCYFTQDQLKKLLSKAHIAMVTSSGYNRKTSLAGQYGPEYLGGANFFHLYDEQGTGQLNHFLKFWRSPHTHPGQLLRIAVAWTQYCLGIGRSVFQDTTTVLMHWEAKWLISLRQYLKDTKATIALDTDFVPKLQRVGDQFIMDRVLEAFQEDPKQKHKIKLINYCRLYLRVTTLSDITNAAGTEIPKAIFKGDPAIINKHSQWHSVHQPRPGPKAWGAWTSACKLFTHQKTLRLTQPLGAWIVPPQEMHRQWEFWHNSQTEILYHQRADGTYSSHKKLYQDYDKEISQANISLSAAAVPVDVTTLTNIWAVIPNYSQWAIPAPNPVPQPVHFEAFSSQLPEWEQLLLNGIRLLVPQEELLETMQSSATILCSDGSKRETRASHVWVLSSLDGTRLAQCSGPAFGHAVTPHRAKGYGILSAFRFLWHLVSSYGCPIKPCNMNCDNESFVKRSNKVPRNLNHQHANSTLASKWDILQEIWHTWTAFPEASKPSLQWVKGHQDEKVPMISCH